MGHGQCGAIPGRGSGLTPTPAAAIVTLRSLYGDQMT
jgi:hypothetical protein